VVGSGSGRDVPVERESRCMIVEQEAVASERGVDWVWWVEVRSVSIILVFGEEGKENLARRENFGLMPSLIWERGMSIVARKGSEGPSYGEPGSGNMNRI